MTDITSYIAIILVIIVGAILLKKFVGCIIRLIILVIALLIIAGITMT